MKKFLQACDLGGSIYGKGKRHFEKGAGEKTKEKEDLMSSYRNLYKNQVNMMNKVFGRSR
jgi:hypothetical protein